MQKNTHQYKKDELRPLYRLEREEISIRICRSTENNRSKIGDKSSCKGIYSPSANIGIYYKSQKKTEQKKDIFISKKRIKHNKHRIHYRSILSENINSAQYHYLKNSKHRNENYI